MKKTYSIASGESENDGIKQQCAYKPLGYSIEKSYDCTGKNYIISNFDDSHSELRSETFPGGYVYNYSYDITGEFTGISTTQNINGQTRTLSNTLEYTRGLLTKLRANNNENVYEFEYDGFGVQKKVKINGEEYSNSTYKNDCTYTPGTTLSQYDYTLINYANGYKEKTYYDKKGNVASLRSVDSEGAETELLGVSYDEFGRVTEINDKFTGENVKSIYEYKSDGNLSGVLITGGGRSGYLSVNK